jgi:hypothetical protein
MGKSEDGGPVMEATIFAKICSGLRLDAVVSHTLWMGKERMEPPWWRPTIFATVCSGRMIRTVVGLRPSFSAHVRWGEHGAPVDSLRRSLGVSRNGIQSAGRMSLGSPDSFSVRGVAVRLALCLTLRMSLRVEANDLRHGVLRSNDKKRMRDPGSGSPAVTDHRMSRDQRCR